jgi:hypothetical protein
LLAATGGALEIPKCKFHLAFYHFSASGAPVLAPSVSQVPNHLPTIAIFPDPTAASPQNLEYLRPGQPRKTLGCYKSPSGNPKPGLETLLQNAIDKSSRIQNSCLDPRATHTYYFAVLLPSLSYTLPVSHYSNQALDTVDKKIAIPFLNKLGYSRSTPRPVRYGPLKYRGVNLHPLKDIQGSGQILQCLKHLRTPLVVQRLWLIALHWAQLQSGFQKPILEDPNTLIPHLESQYIHSIRQFLQSINGSIRTEIPYTIPLQRVRNQSIMEIKVTFFLLRSAKQSITADNSSGSTPSLTLLWQVGPKLIHPS